MALIARDATAGAASADATIGAVNQMMQDLAKRLSAHDRSRFGVAWFTLTLGGRLKLIEARF